MNLTNEQQKAVSELREAFEEVETIAPPCNPVDRCRISIRAVIRELEQAQRERDDAKQRVTALEQVRDEALKSVRIHSNMLRVSVENVDAANKERDDLRAKLDKLQSERNNMDQKEVNDLCERKPTESQTVVELQSALFKIERLEAKLLAYRETATYIVANFQELNGSECTRRCGTCIKCRLEALL